MTTRRVFRSLCLGLLTLALLLPALEAAAQPAATQPSAAISNPQILTLLGRIDELEARVRQLEIKYEAAQDPIERTLLDKEIRNLRAEQERIFDEINRMQQNDYNAAIETIQRNYEQRIRDIEQRKSDKRRAAIADFERILAESPNTRMAPALLYRLAQLYFEESNESYLEAQQAWDEQADRLMQQGVEITIPEPSRDYRRSIELYRELVNGYPDYEFVDGAYYLLAYCLGEMDQYDEANKVFAQLIERVPDSRFVPEAYVRMGEYYFQLENYRAAIERYQNVLQFKDSNFYDKALYKLGWCYYMLDEFATAIDYFHQVITYYETRRSEGGSSAEDMRKESLDYIAISFADDKINGGPEAAQAFIASKGTPEWGFDVLYKMGEVYLDTTYYLESVQSFALAIETYPANPKVPDAYSKTMEAYERDRDITSAIAVGGKLADQIGPSSQWWKDNEIRPAAQNRALEVLELGVYGSATTHHERAQAAQKTDDMTTAKAEYAQAIDSYRIFLEVYPESEKAYEATVNLAESLFFSERYPEAAAEYDKLLRYPDGEYYKESAFSLTKTWENQVKSEGGLPYKDTEAQAGSEVEPKAPATAELTPSAQKWVAVNDQYVQLFPEDPENPERASNLLFTSGNIYFSFGQFAKSREYFEKLVYEHPNTAGARAASARILDSYRFEQDWVNLSKWAGIIEDRVPPESAEAREMLSAIGTGAAFKNAESLSGQGKYDEAVAAYVQIAADDSKSENAPKALHNAALIYESQMGRLDQAALLYIRVGREYPAWDRAKEDMFHAASLYEDLLEFDLASQIYEQYYQTFPDSADAEKALYNAGLIQEKSRNFARAISIYSTYSSKFPNSPDAALLALSIPRLYEQSGNQASAESAYQRFIKEHNEPNGLIEAYYKLGSYNEARGNRSQAEQYYKNAVDIFRRVQSEASGPSRRMAAEARFRLLQPEFNAYMAVKLELPAQRMKRLLDDKAQRWVKLRDAYQEIVSYGDFDMATAAIYNIGAICVEFAETLYKAPIPEGLSPEEEDQYVVILEDQAAPVEQKAEEAFRLNIDKGRQARYRNKWIDQSYDMMQRYEAGIVQEKYELIEGVDRNTPLRYGPLTAPAPAMTPAAAPAATPAATPAPDAGGGQ